MVDLLKYCSNVYLRTLALVPGQLYGHMDILGLFALLKIMLLILSPLNSALG